MATIGTRINETTGEEEIIIKDINNDLNNLLNIIAQVREEEKQQEIKTRKIFITEDIIFNDIFSDNIEIYNCVFEKKIDFSDCRFEKKIKLYNCTFLRRAYFNNTTFKDLVDFYGCTFKEPQQFHKTDFNRVAIFSNATFEKEAQFIYCTTDTSSSYISFQSAKFKKGFDIARANFNCKVSCWDIQVEDKGLLEAINSDYYFSDFNLKWLDENRNNKKELAKWTPASKKLRESMRFIKNNFYAENNQIEGLEFYKKEMDVYEKELKSNLKGHHNSNKEKIKSKKNWTEIILVALFIILLIIYLLGNEDIYWALIIIFSVHSEFAINKLNVKKQDIIDNLKENPLVNSTLLILTAGCIYLYFSTLYQYPQETCKLSWVIFGIGILVPVLFITELTKDNIILLLNKHSNNFGTDWVRGVIFTTMCGLITFSLMANKSELKWDISIEGFNRVLNNTIKIINVFDTNPFDKENNKEDKENNKDCKAENKENKKNEKDDDILFSNINGITFFILIIGRIFIAYGSYQTVQAFRKYGKS